jgi:8-oxo-dGTP diphosphatase
MRYSYCPTCGGKLEPDPGGNRSKPRCTACGSIFYQNPAVGVAAILIRDRKILLGRRNGTYSGMWCIPCGYVEWDEDVCDAVKREFLEETGLEIGLDGVFDVLSNFHDPNQHTVGVWFLARELGGRLKAGDDLAEVSFFAFNDLPKLAFPTDLVVLHRLNKENYI